jgi:hypothetical protein
MKILTNEKKNNHFSCLKKMATKADTLIIVSPFITDDIPKLIEGMATIKKLRYIHHYRNMMILLRK